VSSPERAPQAFQIFVGDENSFQDIDPQDERRPSGRNIKRNTEMYDRDESWLLQQSDESAPDNNFMVNGRKAIRTNDNMMLDDVRRSLGTHHDDHDHAARAQQVVTHNMDYDAHYAHQQDPSGVQYPADGGRVMIQRDEPTRTSRNITRTFQDAEQRFAELDHLARGCRAGSEVQHSAGQRTGTPYAHTYNTIPAPKTTPMIYGGEVLTDRYPADAYNNNDVARAMPTAIIMNDPDARGSQSSSQSIPAQQQARIHVKEHVAAWETDI
jgi:hypothetical protein